MPIKRYINFVKNILVLNYGYALKTRRMCIPLLDNRVGFVLITKTASTSLRRIIAKKMNFDDLNKDPHEKTKTLIVHPKDFKNLKIKKILVVRNPFERVVSCYNHLYSLRNYPTYIPSLFFFGRINYSFDVFVDKLHKCPSVLLDPHMMSTYDLSHFRGDRLFDEFYKIENIDRMYSENLTKEDFESIPNENVRLSRSWKKFYSKRETVEKVYEIYKKDIDRFDFRNEYEEILYKTKNQ